LKHGGYISIYLGRIVQIISREIHGEVKHAPRVGAVRGAMDGRSPVEQVIRNKACKKKKENKIQLSTASRICNILI
jgi:hypothetical protein